MPPRGSISVTSTRWPEATPIAVPARSGRVAPYAIVTYAAFFADSVPVIIAVQLLHGVCYAFFFATVYIFVDAAFPKDVRSSAQGLFNLLILGVGNVVASFLFPTLIARFSTGGVVDYQSLFLVSTGMALAAVLLLALFFRPQERGPATVAAAA